MKLLFAIAGTLLMLGTVRAEWLVQPFDAHYTVYARGIRAGEGSIRLQAIAGDRYRMESRLQASGFARLLFRDRISEQVDGRIYGTLLQPEEYHFVRRGGSRDEETDYHFDWAAARVQAHHNGDSATLELAPRVLDPLSTYLQVMWDLRNGYRTDRYQLLDETEIKTYAIEFHGRETLTTPLGELTVQRVSRQRPGSSRRVELWFAPDFDYLPVQVTQYQDGSENLRMTIRRFERG